MKNLKVKPLKVKPLKVKRITKLSAATNVTSGGTTIGNGNKKTKEIIPRISKILKKKLNIKNKVLMKHGIKQNPALKTSSTIDIENENEKKMIKIDRSKLFTSLEADIASMIKSTGVGVNVQPAISQMNNKLQKSVAVREVERMKLVQSSSVYQSNPLDAIKSHLESISIANAKKNSNIDTGKDKKNKNTNTNKKTKKIKNKNADVEMTY